MDADDDWALRQALGVSMVDFSPSLEQPAVVQLTQQPPRQPTSNSRAAAAAGMQQPPRQPTSNSRAAAAAGPSTQGATTGKQRRPKKLPTYNPSQPETDDCFKELASQGRSRITIQDILATGAKLGLDVDHQKAVGMLEYLTENQIHVQLGGSISSTDFQGIVDHFRVIR